MSVYFTFSLAVLYTIDFKQHLGLEGGSPNSNTPSQHAFYSKNQYSSTTTGLNPLWCIKVVPSPKV